MQFSTALVFACLIGVLDFGRASDLTEEECLQEFGYNSMSEIPKEDRKYFDMCLDGGARDETDDILEDLSVHM